MNVSPSGRQMLQAGARWCAIEASSIGIAEHRLEGTRIRTAVFTNFTQDHLDYHGSMQAYWAAKRQLFSWEGLQSAVVNIDDPQGFKLAAELADTGLDLWTCSRRQDARLRAWPLPSREGLSFEVREGDALCRIDTTLAGDYNIAPDNRDVYDIADFQEVMKWMYEVEPTISPDVEIVCVSLCPPSVNGEPRQRVYVVTGVALSDSVEAAKEALAPLQTCPIIERAFENKVYESSLAEQREDQDQQRRVQEEHRRAHPAAHPCLAGIFKRSDRCAFEQRHQCASLPLSRRIDCSAIRMNIA